MSGGVVVEAQVQRVPIAQLKPSEWNPRLIHDSRFKQLCRSLEADPDFMEQRPILATFDGTIYAGNMRWRAAKHLGWSTVPTILSDIDPTLAKERALKDNNQFGEWQEQELAELLAELQMGGRELETLGFPDGEVERLLDSVGLLSEAEAFGALPDDDKAPFQQMTFTVTDDQAETIKAAIEQAKAAGGFLGTGNENSNGNALARVCAVYVS
jgi:hypothetical protein